RLRRTDQAAFAQAARLEADVAQRRRDALGDPDLDLRGLAPAEPALGPALELRQRWLELVTHLGELVFDPQRRPGDHLAFHDPARLELLHPLGQQAIGELRHGLRDLGEAQRPIHQHAQDRTGPAPPHQLYGLVIQRAAVSYRCLAFGLEGIPGSAHTLERLRRPEGARRLRGAVDRNLAGDID